MQQAGYNVCMCDRAAYSAREQHVVNSVMCADTHLTLSTVRSGRL